LILCKRSLFYVKLRGLSRGSRKPVEKGDARLDKPSNWNRYWQGEEAIDEMVTKVMSGERIWYAMPERYSQHVTPKGAEL